MENLLEQGKNLFLHEDVSLKEISSRLGIKILDLKQYLEKEGYIVRPGIKGH